MDYIWVLEIVVKGFIVKNTLIVWGNEHNLYTVGENTNWHKISGGQSVSKI